MGAPARPRSRPCARVPQLKSRRQQHPRAVDGVELRFILGRRGLQMAYSARDDLLRASVSFGFPARPARFELTAALLRQRLSSAGARRHTPLSAMVHKKTSVAAAGLRVRTLAQAHRAVKLRLRSHGSQKPFYPRRKLDIATSTNKRNGLVTRPATLPHQIPGDHNNRSTTSRPAVDQ